MKDTHSDVWKPVAIKCFVVRPDHIEDMRENELLNSVKHEVRKKIKQEKWRRELVKEEAKVKKKNLKKREQEQIIYFLTQFRFLFFKN